MMQLDRNLMLYKFDHLLIKVHNSHTGIKYNRDKGLMEQLEFVFWNI